MSNKETQRGGVASMVTTGVKDLPRNASWLLAKALNPGSGNTSGSTQTKKSARKNGTGYAIADSVRSAGASLKDVLPTTGDSVELRLQRARSATERARDAEHEAMAAAEEAKESVEKAKQTKKEEDSRLRGVREDQDRRVKARVAEARQKADERVEAERVSAEQDAEKTVSKEQAAAEQRIAAARTHAERVKEKADRALADATAQLAEARRLADEAAAAAESAAAEAHQEADRLTAQAQTGANERDGVAAEAEKLQKAAASTATKVARRTTTVPRRSAARGRGRQDLTSLSKQELLELAKAKDVSGRSSMSKTALVKALRATR
jgi:chromosome segregation ATPase